MAGGPSVGILAMANEVWERYRGQKDLFLSCANANVFLHHFDSKYV